MKKILTTAAAITAVAFGATACGNLDSTGPHAFTAKNQHAKGAKAKVADDTKAKKPAVHLTAGQEQAVGSAQDYLAFSAFSHDGLIDQLSSKAGDGYPLKDAVFAVNHIKVDWNKQAVRSAKDYLDFTHFSRQGLIDQLSSEAGDQYTVAEATYAANHVGL
jgi:Host cell surface-exposed lipoprotein